MPRRRRSAGLVSLRTMVRSSRSIDAQREHAALGDQLVGERRLLDPDGEQLGLEAHLGGPVQGHRVATLTRPRADDVEARRHGPQHPPSQPVVLVAGLVGVDPGRERPDGSRPSRCGHDGDGSPAVSAGLTGPAPRSGVLRSMVSTRGEGCRDHDRLTWRAERSRLAEDHRAREGFHGFVASLDGRVRRRRSRDDRLAVDDRGSGAGRVLGGGPGRARGRSPTSISPARTASARLATPRRRSGTRSPTGC